MRLPYMGSKSKYFGKQTMEERRWSAEERKSSALISGYKLKLQRDIQIARIISSFVMIILSHHKGVLLRRRQLMQNA